MNVTDEEYEDAYREALYCLKDEAFVGFPTKAANGERTCDIDGIAMNDYAVLLRWWGKKIADFICEGRIILPTA